MQMIEAFKTAMSKYADFTGRANRPEFWWYVLAQFLLLLAIGLISDTLSNIASLALLVPSISVAVRRLHDTGRSGWWVLIALTIIGIIPLIIWYATEGPKAPNEYGSPSEWSATGSASTTTPPPPMAPPQV